MSRALFFFRRDLRLEDNSALIEAARKHEVLPMFVLDESLLCRWRESHFRLGFLFQSLQELEQSIADRGGTLLIERGDPTEVVKPLLDNYDIEAVYVNREYTPLGERRDAQLARVCSDKGIDFYVHADCLITEPESVTKKDGGPYTVFTPYYRQASTRPVPEPARHTLVPFLDMELLDMEPASALQDHSDIRPYLDLRLPLIEPGRKGALAALDRLATLQKYDELRDFPADQQTSGLSAHLRFGTCSVREAYHAIKKHLGAGSGLSRQLYWRDFYAQIAFNFPHVFRSAFKKQYASLAWRPDPENLEKWKKGETGFPLIDAGMRQLSNTGQMHNRVRMVVASFLTKNLQIDWREGEKHFAQYLIDFDPAVNNGNWQWAASTGCDAQPYFRIFNPWRQQLKFDKDCAYIKKWIPELRPFDARRIHGLEKEGDFYLPQIVDLKESVKETKLRFSEAR